MSVFSSWMDKNVPSWRGTVQNVTDWGKDRLGFGSGKFNPTSLTSDFLTKGVEGTNPLAANLGLIGMLGSGLMMDPKYAYSQSTYDRLNKQLQPLQGAVDRTGELAKSYMDPNVNRSTGTYGSSVGQMMNQNMMTDAVAQALKGYSGQLGQRQDKGISLFNQQAQLENALSQARMQSSMAAQQAGKFMPQYLTNQFAGLLKYGMGQ